MAKKGKKNNGHRGNTSNGRGWGLGNTPFIPGRGRGYGCRGRGRGHSPHANAPGSSLAHDELDFTIQMYADAVEPPQEPLPNLGGYSTPRGGRGRVRGWRGRGRGRGESYTPPPDGNFNNYSNRGGYNSPVPRGTGTPRGIRGRGRGRGQGLPTLTEPDFSPRRGRGIGASANSSPTANKKLGAGLTLSDLLHATRPLLKPIKFVRSDNTPFLFMHDQEEILKPVAEDIGDDEASHVPTADRVERIFYGDIGRENSSSASEDDDNDEDEEELEEIDFNDLEKLVASPSHKPTSTTTTTTPTKAKKVRAGGVLQMVEDQVTTSFYQRSQFGTPQLQEDPLTAGTPITADRQSTMSQFTMEVDEPPPSFRQQQQNNPLFYVDTQPSFIPSIPSVPTKSQLAVTPMLDDDEEIIVYVAPHPKVHSTPGPRHEHSSNDTDSTAMDVSAFEPYSPPAALPLAAMSIQDSESTVLESQSADNEPSPTSSPLSARHPSVIVVKTSTNSIPRVHTPPHPNAATSSGAALISPAPPVPPSASASALASASASTSTLAPQPVVAPHPTFASLKKFNFLSSSTLSSPNRRLPDIVSPRVAKKQKAWERKKARHERVKARKRGLRAGGRGGFAVYGALADDARLYDDDEVKRMEERRRGDSDLDWGTEDDDDNENEPRPGDEHLDPDLEDGPVKSLSEKAKGKQKAQLDVSDNDHGMDVDSELDIEAMKQFVSGLMGKDAGMFTTMEDVEDAENLRKEDEEGVGVVGGGVGSSDDDDDEEANCNDDEEDESEGIEDVLKMEERLLIGESSDEEEEDDDDDDGELDVSPKSNFQARLDRLRAKARAKKSRDEKDDDDDDDEDMLEMHMTWAEEDSDDGHDDYDDLVNQVQDILDANVELLDSRNRSQRKKLFRAVQNGNFDIDFADIQPARKRKDKHKYLPPELDRQRKAERKRERELQKLINATDPFTKKKGGKKGRKAMLKAAATDPTTINLGPNRIIDITTLVQQIRRFIDNLDGPMTMSLPPANIETRRNIHELALAFGLTSVSKGYGDARYTTLTKTSRTGAGRVNEWKVQRVVKRAGGRGARGDSFGDFDGKGVGGGKRGVPKHKEGDEVGASAPKIGEGNRGFKMLAAMGWSEGNKIGLSGGLDAPLVAIIKHSKLGLGATK